MENFSIVKFLQGMLLPRTENGQEQGETKTVADEKTAEEKPPESAVSSMPTDGQSAVLQFLEEHDKRAKRIRKP